MNKIETFCLVWLSQSFMITQLFFILLSNIGKGCICLFVRVFLFVCNACICLCVFLCLCVCLLVFLSTCSCGCQTVGKYRAVTQGAQCSTFCCPKPFWENTTNITKLLQSLHSITHTFYLDIDNVFWFRCDPRSLTCHPLSVVYGNGGSEAHWPLGPKLALCSRKQWSNTLWKFCDAVVKLLSGLTNEDCVLNMFFSHCFQNVQNEQSHFIFFAQMRTFWQSLLIGAWGNKNWVYFVAKHSQRTKFGQRFVPLYATFIEQDFILLANILLNKLNVYFQKPLKVTFADFLTYNF